MADIFNNISMSLNNKDLWNEFYKNGTEMILRPRGRYLNIYNLKFIYYNLYIFKFRKMFPALKINVEGLCSKKSYSIMVDFIQLDARKYKYCYENSSWEVTTNILPQADKQVFLHKSSPSYGDFWMQNDISFETLKITNNTNAKSPLVIIIFVKLINLM